MANITIPKKLEPIIKAFFAESPQAAKKLVTQAAEAIYGLEEAGNPFESPTRSRPISNKQLEEICALIRGIKPNDLLEAIAASQIVVTHLLGMHKLANSFLEDQKLGLKMLQFSNEAMVRLQKKRSGGMQNVTVNYNYNSLRQELAPIPVEVHG